MVVLLLSLITGCAKKEQIYHGMYNGFRSADQQMQTQDPSYTPDRAPEQRQPSYQEYKKEREQILETDEPIDGGPAPE